jgi:Flp pilus assembly protein TadG
MRRQHARRGQALVETAILAPVFVITLVGAIDIGGYAYAGILVANAAEAGLQYGVQTPTSAEDSGSIQSATTTDASAITLSTPTVTLACVCTSDGSTRTAVSCALSSPCASPNHRVANIQVSVTGSYSPLFSYPGFSGLFSNTISITRTAQMQVSQ